MSSKSLWKATANDMKRRPVQQGEETCDVVIIGGGFTGLSVAYHLQQRNVKTVVLESNTVGSGASGRNGGEVLIGYVMSMQALAEKYGSDAARQMFQMSLDSIDLIENIIKEEDIQCDFFRNGNLLAAYKPSHLDGMRREQEFLYKNYNFETKIVEKQDMHTEMDSDFYHGAHIDEKSAIFHPLNYCLGLANAVEKYGGTIYEHSEAINIKRESHDRVVVETNNGRIIAKQVGMFVNAYTTDVHKLIKKAIVPVESIVLATETLPEDLCKQLIKHNRAACDTKNLLYYFRLSADNRMVFGGSGRTTSKRDAQRLFDNLQAGMVDVFPALKDAKVDYKWSGKVGFTIEKIPYIGQLDDGTHFAFGYAGHGAAMSTLLGKIVAMNMLNEGDKNNPLDRSNLKPIPFHSMNATGLGMMKYYFKFLDYIS
ncbi:NAD(P)/FAD-dependent oxidoreductase [Siminovitchia fortis]|uniref:NAD(P)/FAD-dependent oxidoreductase n=1 Tax=Siminovitchia fortis TaxID=254758 RepID=UPI0011A34EBB|nr:FAD-binding oxidoreductase [Siminovitchia fortis]